MKILKILFGILMILIICLIITLVYIGITQVIEGNEEENMAEQLCKENNLIFVDDYLGKGKHCAKIENNIIERFYVEKLNDNEFYLIKRDFR